MTMRRREWIALGAILVVGTVARTYRLDASLWHDEIITLVEFVRLPARELTAAFGSLNNHMFYSLQAKAAIAVFSESAWALRLPAVLFGLGSLVVQWLLARRAVGTTQALVTVFLLAISYQHVWFSQNARGYTGLLFWTTAATLLLVEGLSRPSWRTWTAYAVCVAAAAYTHLSALFFIATHGAVYFGLFVRTRVERAKGVERAGLAGIATWKPIFGLALGVALTALLYAPALWQVAQVVGRQTIDAAAPAPGLREWLNPARALREAGASLSGLGVLAPAALAGAMIAMGIGAVSLARREPVMSAVYLLYFPVATVILLALNSRIWPRFYFIEIGFLYLVVVHGVFTSSAFVARRLGLDRRWPRSGGAIAMAAVVVMTAGSLALLARNYPHPKQDLAGAVAYVERERRPGDAVAALGFGRIALQRYYAPQWAAVDTVAEFEAVRGSAPATWVVIPFPRQTFRARPQLAAIVEKDFARVAEIEGTLGDGAIWIYRSR